MMFKPKLAYKPDPPSDKDLKFSELKPRLTAVPTLTGPQADFFLNENIPVLDQSAASSCVAHGTTEALEVLMGSPVMLSRLMLYWLARNYDNATNQDDGCFIRNAFDALSRYGVCPEALWPYDISKIFFQPPVNCFVVASSNKINSYYRIDSTGTARGDDIEAAIRAGHPVVFGTAVGNDWINYTSSAGRDTAGEAFGPPSSSQGGHCMVVVGVRWRNGKRQFWIRNSWGPSWGIGGHAWMTEEYLTNAATEDLWVPTLMPALKLAA